MRYWEISFYDDNSAFDVPLWMHNNRTAYNSSQRLSSPRSGGICGWLEIRFGVRGTGAVVEVTLERFGETRAQGVGADEVAKGVQHPEQSEHGAELIRSSA